MKIEMLFSIDGFMHKSLWRGGFVWEALLNLSGYIKSLKLGSIQGDVSKYAFLENEKEIFIGKGALVEAGAYIRGPCYIGEGAIIRHGAYIRGDVILGARSIVGHATEVKHSLFFDDAKAAHLAYVGDSILGRDVNLGAGVKCANFRVDHKDVMVHFEGKTINSGMQKFGAIIGDRVQIGCNSVTNPGTIIGRDVLCYPSISIKGVIPSNSVIKRSNI